MNVDEAAELLFKMDDLNIDFNFKDQADYLNPAMMADLTWAILNEGKASKLPRPSPEPFVSLDDTEMI